MPQKTPLTKQIEFLEELSKNSLMRDTFTRDPVGYAKEKGVVLEAEAIKLFAENVRKELDMAINVSSAAPASYQPAVPIDVAKFGLDPNIYKVTTPGMGRFGPEVASSLLAVCAVVSAVAAVVSAAAAVYTAVKS